MMRVDGSDLLHLRSVPTVWHGVNGWGAYLYPLE